MVASHEKVQRSVVTINKVSSSKPIAIAIRNHTSVKQTSQLYIAVMLDSMRLRLASIFDATDLALENAILFA